MIKFTQIVKYDSIVLALREDGTVWVWKDKAWHFHSETPQAPSFCYWCGTLGPQNCHTLCSECQLKEEAKDAAFRLEQRELLSPQEPEKSKNGAVNFKAHFLTSKSNPPEDML